MNEIVFMGGMFTLVVGIFGAGVSLKFISMGGGPGIGFTRWQYIWSVIFVIAVGLIYLGFLFLQ